MCNMQRGGATLEGRADCRGEGVRVRVRGGAKCVIRRGERDVRGKGRL